MSMLTNILYWLSTGMLVPVILLLLLCFGWALALLGDLYGQFARRLRARESRTTLNEAARAGGVKYEALSSALDARSSLHKPLTALEEAGWHEVHGDKIICDYEAACRRSVESAMLLMRVGPMLGLMGTLIPMGPALVGLAAGDIASMAANMQVAFSTTVLGIFVGAVGLVVQLFKKRWAQADSELLRYLLEVAADAPADAGAACRDQRDGEEAA
jgi:biopolymer transport protein ExbB/TolQ